MPDFDLSSYVKQRASIATLLHQTSSIAEQLNQLDTAKSIEDSIQQLMDDKFNVVVVGEFSRGKSTVINALLGSPVLPASMKPTTAILNKISYNDSVNIRLVYRETGNIQKTQDISPEHFKKIVAPIEPVAGDSDSFKRYESEMKKLSMIEYAEIGYPSVFCRDGVEIIDTPGTNDLDPRREEIANSFIPNSDAAVLVLSAKQPLAQSEVGFLNERLLKASIQKIFFVINFKDQLRNQAEEAEVIEHIRKNLPQSVSDPRLFLISAKGALNNHRKQAGETLKVEVPPLESTGYIEFESQLARFLVEERGRVKLLKPIERCLVLIRELDNSIQRTSQSLHMNLDKFQQNEVKIRHDLNELSATINNASEGLGIGLGVAGENLKQEVRQKLTMIATTAVTSFSTYQGPLTWEDVARAVESTVAPMQTELSQWINQRQNEILLYEYNRANQRFAFQFKAIDNSISEFLSSSGSVAVYSAPPGSYSDKVITPTIASTAGAFLLAGVLTGGWAFIIVPGAGVLFHTLFESKFRDSELGRMRNQIDARYHDSIPEMLKSWEKQWNQRVNSLVDTFNSEATRRKSSLEAQLDDTARLLRAEKSQVDQAKQKLNNLQGQLNNISNILMQYQQELNNHRSNY